MSATNDLKKYFKKLNKVLASAVTPQQMKYLGSEAVKLVVKRTRLGYGVAENDGQRFALSSIPWSPVYAKVRKIAGKTGKLDASTRAGKSNLTFTGQMLRSLTVIAFSKGSVEVGVSGTRDDGQTNEDVATSNAERGRVFNRLSLNEHAQLTRIYRRSFTGLLKKLARVG
jgi:hypothetical protein